MKTPEGYEKDDICKYLDKIGAWYFRPFMSGYGKSGVADIIACVPILITPDMVGKTIGVFTSLEVKREGKQPTELQKLRIKEIQKVRGVALWGIAAKIIGELHSKLRLP